MNTVFEMEKHEKLFVAEFTDCINDLLEECFKSSQRIKLVCYDVSSQYIVFGAKNGSIHIYQRGDNPAFFKLIPSKNSAAIDLILISPNEENIVISDETGMVLILENCFLEKNFHTRVYTELKGKNNCN
ncbi:hypothetical protein HHI36_010065 [Cryptolaemus montrouzieri]|uniref:Uncharacterized protein n=1 Tax=Cryptolaemus montrouzieri TaxID=559131 RepID=A0ABD2MIE5_9CUCU